MDWLLLLHQIPPNPAYFRAKVLRRLNDAGAVPVRKSAYVLPAGEETEEDFQWIRREIEREGGEAWLFRAAAIGGISDEHLQQAFRTARDTDFTSLADEIRNVLNEVMSAEFAAAPLNRCRKLKNRYDELCRIDFFGSAARSKTEALMQRIENALKAAANGGETSSATELTGRKWVTRRGAKVDRIGSAWLIRTWIDPAATFSFVDPKEYRHAPGELRFDMFEGEFTHDGDLCTFEVLLRFAKLNDPGLQALAEIVHDIDLKEQKYGRPEAAGLSAMIQGLAVRYPDDANRIQHGAVLFDALYAQLRSVKD
jgi:hypothetical protein